MSSYCIKKEHFFRMGYISRSAIVLAHLFVLIFVVHSRADDIQFTASVDRTMMDLSERITLTLQIQGAISSFSDPKLPDLSDFRIISGPNESSTFQFINGRTSSTKTWSYVLRPRRTGLFSIGSAEITRKGKVYRTDPITVVVSRQGGSPTIKADSSAPVTKPGVEPPELFIQVSADKTELYQNQQVVLTYTIFTRVSVTGYEISRLPSTPGFWMEEFDQPKQPGVQDVVIGGRHYRKAVIRHVALFPTRSGEIVVDPLEVTCQVQTQERKRKRRDPFDIFFDSPFDRFRTEERYIETDPLTLNVLPFPSEGKPENFSGAVGDFNLRVSIDHQKIKTNEALTMTVRISGNGNVKLLPEPDFKIPPDFEGYEPRETVKVKKSSRQINGTKTFEYVLIPRIPGVGKLPRILFSYFDPVAKSYKTLTQGGFTVEVEGSAADVIASQPGFSRENVKLMAQDICYLKSPGRLLRAGMPYRIPASYWAGMVLPPLIAVSLWLGARLMGAPTLKARRRARRIYTRTKRQLSVLSKSATTRSSGDGSISEFYGAIHRIMTDYLGEKLRLPGSGLKEEEVLQGLATHNVPGETLQFLGEVFQKCNTARFTPESADPAYLDQVLHKLNQTVDKIESQWGRSS